MTAATIDRHLAPAKAKDQVKGKTTTKPSPLLRSSVKIRKATDKIEAVPGVFEGDRLPIAANVERRIRPEPEPDLRAHRLDMTIRY